MINKSLFILLLGLFLSSCHENNSSYPEVITIESKVWNTATLKDRVKNNLDSNHWDNELLNQDIETYHKYAEVFQSFPLNKSPFPVARYDYAVSSAPFVLEMDNTVFKGVRIGEYEDPESEKVSDKLTLLVLTNNAEAEESTLVESRNYPYLTAQGTFKVTNNVFNWVFSASPDGYSTLLLNMKLFDLRFGETIIIYPQKDQSFLYDQINDSPNNYKTFAAFKEAIQSNSKVRSQLKSDKNIRI